MKMRLLRGYRRRQLHAWVATTLTTVLILAAVWSPCAVAAEVKQKYFASAEAGVEALMAALKANDVKAMLAILGADARPLIVTGDPVADHQERERVVRDYEEAHSLAMSGETKAVLQIGKDDWPMPIPLVRMLLAGASTRTPARKKFSTGVSGAMSLPRSRCAGRMSMRSVSTICAIRGVRRCISMRRSS
jgi:hypothetical protein